MSHSPAQETSAPPSQTATAPSQVEPNEIGWMFVPQFYTFLYKEPARLHCFYTKKSTFVHGTEGEECSPRYGQQEIHDKIMKLDFQDCKVYVSQVDSQSSAEGGIIVQVLGEMSNKGGRWRKFAQTFFLAEQPSGYFVLNDIFRYLKEDSDSEDHDHDGEGDLAASEADIGPPVTSVPQHPSLEVPGMLNSSYPPASAAQSFNNTPSFIRPSNAPETTLPIKSQETFYTEQPPIQQINGFYDSAISERSATPPIPKAPTPEEKPIIAAPAPEPPKIEEPVETPTAEVVQPSTSIASSAADASNGNAVQAPARMPSPVPQAEAKEGERTAEIVRSPPAKTTQIAAAPATAAPQARSTPTWASLAANSSKNSRGLATFAPAVVPTPASSGPPSISAGSDRERNPAQTAKEIRSNHHGWNTTAPAYTIASIATTNTFIKGLTYEHDPRELRETLVRKFGPVRELDSLPDKNCAFAEFVSVEGARKAVQHCFPEAFGGQGGLIVGKAAQVLIIEPKKSKASLEAERTTRRGPSGTSDQPSGERPQRNRQPQVVSMPKAPTATGPDEQPFTPAREPKNKTNAQNKTRTQRSPSSTTAAAKR